MIAIDWHFVVFEEILDVALAAEVKPHSSIESESAHSRERSIPLSRCIEKFTEEEVQMLPSQ